MIKRFVAIDNDARDFGFDWPDVEMILSHIASELEEIKSAIDEGEAPHRVQEEIGDLIAASISLCVFMGFEAEETLLMQNEKFSKRIEMLKKLTKDRGLDSLKGQTLQVSLKIWNEVKKLEKLTNETITDHNTAYNDA